MHLFLSIYQSLAFIVSTDEGGKEGKEGKEGKDGKDGKERKSLYWTYRLPTSLFCNSKLFAGAACVVSWVTCKFTDGHKNHIPIHVF